MVFKQAAFIILFFTTSVSLTFPASFVSYLDKDILIEAWCRCQIQADKPPKSSLKQCVLLRQEWVLKLFLKCEIREESSSLTETT